MAGKRIRYLVLSTAAFCLSTATAWSSDPQTDDALSIQRLKTFTIEQLLETQVTTLSRKEERWWTAPGAVDVVLGEDIRRSSAQNLPEALRLASGVDMAQSSARSWAVSTRGFNVLAANKISIVMDGRSLFTPFFSGVQWDAQDAMLEDIDRIEVVRGPVGALWGAFAVNGFAQIISKSAEDTQGTLVSVATGTEDPALVSVRYGGRSGERTYYRVYAKYSETDWTYLPNGQRAQPSTDFFQTGFRIDRGSSQGDATVQGDVYTNKGTPRDHLQTEVSGANVLGHWKHTAAGDAEFDVVSYYDHTFRVIPATWKEIRDTLSLAIKYRAKTGRQDLLFGFDANYSWDDIAHLSIITMDPAKRLTHTVGFYVQDTITIVPDRSALVVGTKVEDNSFSGVEVAPSLRAVFTPDLRSTFWAAVSRAVRAPVRIDQDLVFGVGNTVILRASDDFKSETVLAYEFGYRTRIGNDLTFDLALFHNDYRDLRTTEPVGTAALPLTFKNTGRAKSDGAELSMVYIAKPNLSFNLSYRYLDLVFSKLPESRDTGDFSTEANDPRHLVSVGVRANLSDRVEFDAVVRHVSERPHPVTPPYTSADLRLAWEISSRWEISLSGRHLFAPKHRELVTGNSLNELIAPSATLKATWRY